jgi:hypothetical protein
MVITSSLDHRTTVSVWGAVSGTEEITIQGHEGKVTAVAFSPDGTHVSLDLTTRLCVLCPALL